MQLIGEDAKALSASVRAEYNDLSEKDKAIVDSVVIDLAYNGGPDGIGVKTALAIV